jgi:hypothetical protein
LIAAHASAVRPIATPRTSSHTVIHEGSITVDRCNNCQFYDRQDKGSGIGQCRRQAPALSPINAKAYMIEGVWPTVRDDDWCGEWKSSMRRGVDPRFADLAATATPSSAVPLRPSPMTVNATSPMAALAIGAASRGSD